jgi:DNA-binding NtrC family response regulator
MPDMDKIRSLISFVGMRDPYPENDEESGPLLSLLFDAEKNHRPFDDVWLLCTGGTFLERARDLEREARDEGVRTRFLRLDFPVKDVIDYAEIWQLLERSFATIKEQAGALPRDWHFLLDSGTPQMKTSLFLAARSGLFPATLLQGIPPRFAGGTYKVREVRLDGLPEMSTMVLKSDIFREPAGGSSVAPRQPPEGHAAEEVKEAGPQAAGAYHAEKLIGNSPAFAEALRRAISAARYDEPVLMLGETGTGKTMIARRIHEAGSRRAGPFVEVNCSAIPENLAESELFGHLRGAFTGADKARSGKFRAAQGGTLFLDEVGDLSLDVQAKLLKALEDKTVTPLGSDAAETADTRLIAATNRDLPALIDEGKFRRDLYERLKVVVIRLPPLRERREDIRPLAARFIGEWNAQYCEHRYLTDEALLLLESWSWPGNVRELNNAIKSAINTAMGEALGPESLPDEIRCAVRADSRGAGCGEGLGSGAEALPREGINLRARLLQVEWEYVAAALRNCGGNRESAAKLLGMTGHAFRKALRERLAAFADEGWETEI